MNQILKLIASPTSILARILGLAYLRHRQFQAKRCKITQKHNQRLIKIQNLQPLMEVFLMIFGTSFIGHLYEAHIHL